MTATFVNLRKRYQTLSPERRKLILIAAGITVLQLALALLLHTGNPSVRGQTQVRAIVSTRALAPGEKISADDLRLANVSLQQLGALLVSPKEAEEVVGLTVRGAVEAGQPLSFLAVAGGGTAAVDPEKVPTGKRLHIVDVKLGRLASIVRPGDKVDLIATMVLPDIGNVTDVLLDAIEVVSVDGGREGGNALSFHLTPEQVKLAIHASQFARFTVALRNPNDISAREKSSAMTLSKFLDDPKLQSSLNGALWSMPNSETKQKSKAGQE